MEGGSELLKVSSLAALTGHPCKEPQATQRLGKKKKKNSVPFYRWACDICPSSEAIKGEELGKEPKGVRLQGWVLPSRPGPSSLGTNEMGVGLGYLVFIY